MPRRDGWGTASARRRWWRVALLRLLLICCRRSSWFSLLLWTSSLLSYFAGELLDGLPLDAYVLLFLHEYTTVASDAGHAIWWGTAWWFYTTVWHEWSMIDLLRLSSDLWNFSEALWSVAVAVCGLRWCAISMIHGWWGWHHGWFENWVWIDGLWLVPALVEVLVDSS